ncbi:MAG TPA: hypothetical protein VGM90_38775 [Kofleriaceae bacterium]|jgi:hypothetical protein
MSELDENDDKLVAKLRALPSEGTEPDWNQLAQRIHASLPSEVHRPWWRTLLQPRWLAPILAGAVGLGALVVIETRSTEKSVPHEVAMLHDASVEDSAHTDETDDVALDTPTSADMLLWLDGAEVAIDSAAEDVLDVDDLLLGQSTERAEGLMTTDDSWVDGLDDADVAALDQWLDQQTAKKKKG